MITHRALDGSWAVCPDADACELLFHFPDQTPAEMAAVPDAVLYALLGVVQPPAVVFNGVQVWADPQGRTHRDYDLPAVIRDDDKMEWRRENVHHRDGERPAIIDVDGRLEWWIEGTQLVVEIRPGGPYLLRKAFYDQELTVFPAGQLAALHGARQREEQGMREFPVGSVSRG